MSNVTAEQKKEVKGRGFLPSRDGEHFAARIITVNGVINASQAKKIAEAAEKFGNGQLAFTTKLTVELPGVKFEDIEALSEFIASENLITGGTGSRVRPVVACKGTVCVHGLADTQALAAEIHEEFYKNWYDVKLPHKFKIGVGGCPNNCIKPDLNDLGIVGQRVPDYDSELCVGCKKCAVVEVCPVKAAKLTDKGKLEIDSNLCNNCGKCIESCNFDSIEEKESGYKVYIGGKWGKSVRPGTQIDRLFSKEELMTLIEKAILLFREQGNTGERFGITIDRIGVDKFIEMLLSDEVLERKEEILEALLHLTGGAVC